MRVAANRDVCIGGLCMLNTPAVFDRHDDEFVVVLTEDVSPTNEPEGAPTRSAPLPSASLWQWKQALGAPARRRRPPPRDGPPLGPTGRGTTSTRAGPPAAHHPEQLAVVRDDPALVQPAVEELLRWP